MSEISYTPPPPPPPPPPVQPVASTGYDFAKPFTFVFEDPNWVQKILIGGLFYLAGFLIVGWFFILGYCARLARNVIDGVARPLPEWDDLGDLFAEGLRLVGIVLLYSLPIIVLAVLAGVPAALVSAIHDENAQVLGSGISGCIACLIVPVALTIFFTLPVALLRAVTERRMGAAFELAAIWSFIQANIGNYFMAILVYLVARMIGGAGVILLCIGVIFTGFWAMLVMTAGFAQVYRLRRGA